MGREAENLIDVRAVLESNAVTTTVDRLKTSGRKRVKVINARQISALIEESVARVIAAQRGRAQEDVDTLVENSREEFRKLVAERERELAELRAEREDLEALEARMAETRERIADLKDSLRETREENNRLRAEVDELRAGGAEAVPGEVISTILEQLGELKAGIDARPAAAAEGDGAAMDTFAREMSAKLEQFGRKIGISGAVGDEEDISLDAIFNTAAKMESNLEDVDVKQRTGAGIGDALAKMRAMKKKSSSPQESE